LYDAGPHGDWVFVLVTVVMGGLAAYATGSAIAATWRPRWQLVVYGFLIACAVRFIHYALFHEPFIAPRSYVVDLIVLIAAAAFGFRVTRRRQMREQYDWLAPGTAEQTVRRADL
ncbi:MAG: hypothetical protein J0I57_14330, partial [Hyphomicrobium sp.]|nr:hypothetical protein [Hyphomicrobium sp.]